MTFVREVAATYHELRKRGASGPAGDAIRSDRVVNATPIGMHPW